MRLGRTDAAAFLGLLAGTLQLARATPDRAESEIHDSAKSAGDGRTPKLPTNRSLEVDDERRAPTEMNMQTEPLEVLNS